MSVDAGRWRVLVALSLGVMLTFSLWFSASAVVPELTALWGLDAGGQARLTISVQAGFILGSLLSAIFNLADVFRTRRLMVVSALLAAATNAAVALAADSAAQALLYRTLTGVFLAGIYAPPSNWHAPGSGAISDWRWVS